MNYKKSKFKIGQVYFFHYESDNKNTYDDRELAIINLPYVFNLIHTVTSKRTAIEHFNKTIAKSIPTLIKLTNELKELKKDKKVNKEKINDLQNSIKNYQDEVFTKDKEPIYDEKIYGPFIRNYKPENIILCDPEEMPADEIIQAVYSGPRFTRTGKTVHIWITISPLYIPNDKILKPYHYRINFRNDI